ncbi:MAG: hypothetical protein CMJ40_03545 [Phycisphaerae bacterium]|nr:hypothetical protein [Phycisphaerae bacterium]
MDPKDPQFRPDTNTPTIFLGGEGRDGIDLPAHLRLEPGDQVSNYKIVSLVAEGGFGIVYLAEQHAPVRRRVALKIIKPGMDTVAVITRFEAERQALAILDHPNIATVYDAGATDDGRPFFVMEYVEGVPITEYCDDNRLDTSQRLNLMIEVCAAIQHAHMKGIIHRDIKPSNILIATDDDGRPRAKVIDFGVAKATSMELTERSFCTETGQLIGTPEYMSPEQADLGGTDIDTRSDVYSLGMILYELITGALPFESIQMRQAGFSELCRIIQEETPPKPSTRLLALGGEASKVATKRKTRPADLAGMLKRELEWIPLKALRKLRDERYESAVALSEDIRRYLQGDVLVAGPETSTYRLRKFLRRNRSGFLVAVIVFLTLLVGLYFALWQLNKAEEQNIALQEQNDKIKRIQEELQAASLKSEEELAKKKLEQEATAKLNESLITTQRELQQVNYISNLLTASLSLESGDDDDALYRLRMASIGQDKKPFEWKHLWSRADQSLGRINRAQEYPLLAGTQPSGDLIFTFSPERFAIWDSTQDAMHQQSTPLTSMDISNQDPDLVLISPDSKIAVLPHEEGGLQAIDMSNGRELQRFPNTGEDHPSLIFSGDGRRIAYMNPDGRLEVINSRTSRKIAEVSIPNNTTDLVMDMTGSRLAAISRNKVELLNSTTGDRSVAALMHDLDVTTAAFDNSAIQLITATMSGDIRIWDVLTGREVAKWTTPVRLASSIQFNPEGNLVLLGNERGRNAIIDIRTGELMAEPSKGWSMSEDWKLIAIPDDRKSLSIMELGATESTRAIQVDKPSATSFSSNSDRLVTADHLGHLQVWNLDSDTPSAISIGQHPDKITDVFFTNDDQRVVAVSRSGARLWSAKGLNQIERIKLDDHQLTSWDFSPTVPWLLGGTVDGEILVIDLTTGEVLGALEGHDAEIVDLEVVANGNRLISKSRDNTLRIWNLLTGEEIFQIQKPWRSESRQTLDQSTTLLAIPSESNDVHIVDTITGVIKANLSGHDAKINAVAFDASGELVATADEKGELRIWSIQSGVVQSRIQAHKDSVNALIFDKDDQVLMTASSDGSIRVWDVEEGTEQTGLRIPIRRPVMNLLISPDGSQIVSGLDDGSIQSWSMQTGDQLESRVGTGSSLTDLKWSPDGSRLIAESADGSMRSWNSTTWDAQIDLSENQASENVRDMNPDANRVAVANKSRNISLHDVDTGDVIFTLRGDDDDINLLSFTPDGARLVASCSNGMIKIWNTQPRSLLAEEIDEQSSLRMKLRPTVESWTSGSNDGDTIEANLSRESRFRSQAEINAIRSILMEELDRN